MNHANEFIYFVAPFISGAVGVGVAWGIIRQKIIDQERRIAKLENQTIVTQPRCDKMRDECRENISNGLSNLKSEVISLRELLLSKRGWPVK